MYRRFVWSVVLCLLMGQATQALPSDTAGQAGVGAPTPEDMTESAVSPLPRYTVSTAQLQAALAQRFPQRYPVAGLLELDVHVPRLRLLPGQNRVSAEMSVQAAGPALQRRHTGSFELDFALRYEPGDHSIRAHQLRINRLQFPSLQPAVVELLNTYRSALAEQLLLEVVLHRLRPQDLVLADVMGMQPGSITVSDAGLVISFIVKPL